ncbi:MAG: LPS export ABC transporter periplasmic protein LptC [candidate division WOR-3 bacterium]|nr:MAG: LPS export ABC transporter periplasmic protein LptC [candidate division WOR-3 bacterium]
MRLWPALVVSVLLLGGCGEEQNESGTTVLPSQIVEGFVLHESSSGTRLYTLEAETAYVYDAEARVDVFMPRVTFYDREGAVHATLDADRGAIFSETDDLVARGNVLVETRDSTRLRTDSLTWNNREQLVRTDAHVVIQTPKGKVEGIGLVSDAGLERIEILSEVTGRSEYRFRPEVDSE